MGKEEMTTLNFSNSINEIDQNQDIRIYDETQ